jgi:hypothetical protein
MWIFKKKKTNDITNHFKTKIGKWQVIHSPSRNFLWIKNAKVAGTSMYRGILDKEVDDLLTYKKNPKEFDMWWDSLTDKKLNSYFKFMFVRNPFDRTLSAFSHIILEEVLDSHQKAWKMLSDKPFPAGGKDILNFHGVYMLFSLFLKRGLRYNMNNNSRHWMPQSVLAECDGKLIVDFVGRYENLVMDWRSVANKIQVSQKLPFVPISNTAQHFDGGTREHLQKLHWSRYYLSIDMILLVSEYYKRDFELFNYKDSIIELKQKVNLVNG